MKKVLALVVFLFVFVFSLKATAEELPWKPLEEKGNASMQKESPFKLPEPLPEFDGIYIITTDGYVELKPEHRATDEFHGRWGGPYVRYHFPSGAFYSIPLKKFKGFLFIGNAYRKENVRIERKAYCMIFKNGKSTCDLLMADRKPVDLSLHKIKTINQFTCAILFESPEKVFDTLEKEVKGYNLIVVKGVGVWFFALRESDSTF